MANRDFKNVKRMIENISEDTAKAAESGGGSGGVGFYPIDSTKHLTVNCNALKQVLINHNIDISARAIGDVSIGLGLTFDSEYNSDMLTFTSLILKAVYNSDISYQGIIMDPSNNYSIYSERWDVTETQQEMPTIDQLLSTGGNVQVAFNEWGHWDIIFFINVSQGYASSGTTFELTTDEINACFTIEENQE